MSTRDPWVKPHCAFCGLPPGDLQSLKDDGAACALNRTAMKNTGAPLAYTGEELRRVVSHVLQGPVYGLADGWAILSFAAMSPDTAKKLIAVALAGDLLANGIPGEGWLRAQELRGERMAALRTALEELK